jgi:uncharacterized protein (DUF1786 family)
MQRNHERGGIMSRFLLVDVGAGTMDVLFYDDESGMHYKAVVRSPILCQAEKAASLPGKILITGCEMGGGAISQVLRERAKETEIIMTASAAMTLHHNLDRVRAWGIGIVGEEEADELRSSGRYRVLEFGDLEPERLERIVTGFGVPFEFDVVGVCAQDHGVPPKGVSHLDYRHNLFKNRLDKDPFPHALLFRSDEVPETFNRLRSIASSAAMFPTGDVYVMDSGMAAILGASMDMHASAKQHILVLDVATSHTVGAALVRGEIAGYFEYHTHDIMLERLEQLLHDLAEGTMAHQQILQEGGHGAYVREVIGFNAVEVIVATGPKRRLVEKSRLPITFGAPWGDNMMTGTVGLLEAIRRVEGREPIRYL